MHAGVRGSVLSRSVEALFRLQPALRSQMSREERPAAQHASYPHARSCRALVQRGTRKLCSQWSIPSIRHRGRGAHGQSTPRELLGHGVADEMPRNTICLSSLLWRLGAATLRWPCGRELCARLWLFIRVGLPSASRDAWVWPRTTAGQLSGTVSGG